MCEGARRTLILDTPTETKLEPSTSHGKTTTLSTPTDQEVAVQEIVAGKSEFQKLEDNHVILGERSWLCLFYFLFYIFLSVVFVII